MWTPATTQARFGTSSGVCDMEVMNREFCFFCSLFLKVYVTLREGGPMPDPLPPLVDDRSAILRQISELGDFQPGSITNASRRCGKPGCHCAKPKDPGHGPHAQLTPTIDGKTATQNLP